MKLKNWEMKDQELIGSVSGSRKYEDGTFIHTSKVITTVYDEGLFLFRTENSIYECLARDFIGSEVELNLMIENAQSSDRQTTRQINLPDSD